MLKAPVPSMSVGGGWRVETISYGKLKPRGEELLCATDGMRDLQSFSQGVCPVPAPPVWAAASMWALADFGGFGRKRREGMVPVTSLGWELGGWGIYQGAISKGTGFCLGQRIPVIRPLRNVQQGALWCVGGNSGQRT